MNIPFVNLKSQYASIKDEIDAAIANVITNTAFVGGPFLQEFEDAFAGYCGAEHCVGVGNGTDSLFIAMKALGIGPGSEVITAANSFIATSEAITMAGARVVFVDIDQRTYNMDVNQLENKITPKTKAIIPVHLYGQPANMGPILELAEKHDLRVIEDAAQAHGAEYHGRRVGTLGDVASFSFYPGKNLGAYGDGGALVTDDEDLAKKIRMLANHGRADKFGHMFEGVNSRLDGLQAAILSAKLAHLEEWTEKRREKAYLYNEYLKETELITPGEIDNVRAVYHLYVVRVEAERRSDLQQYLKGHGVATGIHYPVALPNLKAYEHLGHTEADFPTASNISHEIISLPMFPELTGQQIAFVAEKINSFFKP